MLGGITYLGKQGTKPPGWHNPWPSVHQRPCHALPPHQQKRNHKQLVHISAPSNLAPDQPRHDPRWYCWGYQEGYEDTRNWRTGTSAFL